MFYDNVLVFYMVNVYIPIICSIYNFETVGASVLNLKIWESQANLFQESFFLKYCCAILYIFCINLLFLLSLPEPQYHNQTPYGYTFFSKLMCSIYTTVVPNEVALYKQVQIFQYLWCLCRNIFAFLKIFCSWGICRLFHLVFLWQNMYIANVGKTNLDAALFYPWIWYNLNCFE